MSKKLHTSTFVAFAFALIGLTALGAQAQTMLHARVSYDSGALLVRGQEDTDWAHSTINTLVLPGDTMWVDQEGLGEVEFAGGTFLRLADSSKVEIAAMDPTPTVRGWTGSFYVQRLSRSTGDFIIKTPVGTAEVDENTAVRIDILANGATTVSVRWGRVIVRGATGGGVNAVSGQRVWIDPGLMPSDPQNFDRNQVDIFDEWNQDRAAILAGEVDTTPEAVYASAPAAPATVIGATSLAGNGRWVTVDNTPYWQPTIVDYVPYRNGYWNYVPAYGNVWVGAESFSYYTSHYGYWDYRPSYGWLWSYTGNWQPAYVTALHCNGYYMWSPITRNHYPAYVTDSFRFNVGGVNFSLYATSYVRENYLYSPYYSSGMTHDIANNFYHNNGDVNIWNININNSFNNNNNSGTNSGYNPRNPTFVDYDDAVQQRVRDYNPSRSVRGAATLKGETLQASDRVRSLEQNQGRSSFDVKPNVSGSASLRTAIDDTNRAASVRKVRLDEGAAIMSTPSTRGNRQPSSTPSTSTTPSNRSTRGTLDTKTSGDTVVPSRGAVDANPTGQTRIPTLNTPPSTSNPSGSRTRTSSPDTSSPSTRTRTSVPDKVSAPDSTRTRTTAPNTSSVSTPSTSSTRTRTTAPDASPGSTLSNRTRTSIPDKVSTPSTSSTQPTRSRISAPDTTPNASTRSTRGDYTPTTRVIPQSAPAPTYNKRVEPNYAPAPSRQSSPAPSYSPAPQRQSVEPNYAPAPSRQSSPAPSYSPAPSRQSAPTFSPAPSRQSAPAPSNRNSSGGFNNSQSRGSDAKSFSAPSTSSRGSVSTNSSRSSSGFSRSTTNNSRNNNR